MRDAQLAQVSKGQPERVVASSKPRTFGVVRPASVSRSPGRRFPFSSVCFVVVGRHVRLDVRLDVRVSACVRPRVREYPVLVRAFAQRGSRVGVATRARLFASRDVHRRVLELEKHGGPPLDVPRDAFEGVGHPDGRAETRGRAPSPSAASVAVASAAASTAGSPAVPTASVGSRRSRFAATVGASSSRALAMSFAAARGALRRNPRRLPWPATGRASPRRAGRPMARFARGAGRRAARCAEQRVCQRVFWAPGFLIFANLLFIISTTASRGSPRAVARARVGGMHSLVGYAWAFSAAASSGCMDTLRKVRARARLLSRARADAPPRVGYAFLRRAVSALPRLSPSTESTRCSVEDISCPANSHDDRATDDACSSPDPRVT